MGALNFYGAGETVDTTKTFTVVTQFITADGTTTGTLSEIRRFYVQNNVVIPNSQSTITGVTGNSITDAFCAAQKTAFGDQNEFATKGGLATIGAALAKGMVLVMSIWDDHTANMLWLDAPYPPTKAASTPGVTRGTCGADSGVPATVEANSPNAYVTYANIKWGAINSTFSGGGGTTPVSSVTSSPASTSTSTSTAVNPTGTAGHWAQCGGTGWTGATSCVSGTTCTVLNAYYSQCL
jgi:cellulose 1,4-beta-cellobiosidase